MANDTHQMSMDKQVTANLVNKVAKKMHQEVAKNIESRKAVAHGLLGSNEGQIVGKLLKEQHRIRKSQQAEDDRQVRFWMAPAFHSVDYHASECESGHSCLGRLLLRRNCVPNMCTDMCV